WFCFRFLVFNANPAGFRNPSGLSPVIGIRYSVETPKLGVSTPASSVTRLPYTFIHLIPIFPSRHSYTSAHWSACKPKSIPIPYFENHHIFCTFTHQILDVKNEV
ncbi:MAG: hypothetical protein K9H15_15130, partial [Bacteroidales bacterium]|nr:hypothetical protein [Bacteroidales bacterium]